MKKSPILKSVEKSLPFNWYFKNDHFEKELKKIWSKEWIYACHENNIKEPLSYITLQVSQFNIIILREKNGEIRAYFNTCNHRGSTLCKEVKGTLKTSLITCPYHQWAYNSSDGKLVKTSSFITPKKFDKSKLGLKKVNLKIWNGLIFINLSKKNVSWNIKSRFQDYDSIISKIGLEKFVVGHQWNKEINCNWKIFWENYSECLHCPNIHPELSDLVPIYSRRLMDIREDPDWKAKVKNDDPKFRGGLRKGSETWSTNGSAQGNIIEELKNKEGFQGHIYITNWPAMFIAIFIDHVRVVRILPIDNEHTQVSAEWLFEEKTNKDKSYDKSNVIDFAVKVMEQDGEACELNQKGLYNPGVISGVLMPEEYEVKRFQDWVRKKMKV